MEIKQYRGETDRQAGPCSIFLIFTFGIIILVNGLLIRERDTRTVIIIVGLVFIGGAILGLWNYRKKQELTV